MKYTGPKAKRCRRQGVNIYGSDKYDKILQKKPYKPGKAPRARMSKPSEYSQQLGEKQKVRDMYGLSERQFRNLYKKAAGAKGASTGDMIKQLLERRLDNAIYRAGFALTRLQGRQFISHGLFLVNDRRVTCPSYAIKEGDKISIRPRNKTSPIFSEISAAHDKYLPPGWLKVNQSSLSAEIISLPTADDAEQGIDTRQVIEFYSR
jgi:small subunit ribosomal protein S4